MTQSGTGGGTITGSPDGIACGSTCFFMFTSGTSVLLTVVPDSVSVFSGWSVDCSGTATSTSVTMNRSKTCTASLLLKEIPATTP